MKKRLFIGAAVVLLALSFAGCNLLGIVDPIVGNWNQSTINGAQPVLSSTIAFTATAYSGSTSGVNSINGIWVRSASEYTLSGTFFGFVPTTVIFTPVFSNWNNTMTITDGNGAAVIYTRQ